MNEEMIIAVNAIYAIAQRSVKKKFSTSTGFEPMTSRLLTGAMLYQRSYEATDVGTRRFFGRASS